MKNGEFCHFWADSETGTGTPLERYRYRWCRSKTVSVPPKSVPVPPSRTESISIPIRAVPVPMVPAAPVFVIFAYLS